MTEEARAPTGEPDAKADDARPRPRRRRRGGRGRGRSGAASRSRTTGEAADGAKKETTGTDKGSGAPAEGPRAPRARRSGRAAKTEKTDKPQEGEEGAKAERPAPKSPSSKKTASRKKAASTRRKSTAVRTRSAKTGEKRDTPEAAKDRAKKDAANKVAEDGASSGPEDKPGAEAGSSTRRRRRRRRRKKPSEGGDQQAKPEAQKAPPKKDRPTPTPGPTRVTRGRRRGTVTRRRREEIIPERRLGKTMLLTEHGDRDQIAVVEDRELVEHYVTRAGASSMVGNIYLGRVQNVLPGMEAAFVDVGRGRNAVLYAGEVSYDEDVEGDTPRIEQVLKAGQAIIVQVTKDPMGGKGARLTGQVSLPGRFLVYVPDGGASGISKRLPVKERDRLRDILKRIRPSGAGVIVRTAAEGASDEELAADLERLKKAWDSIKRKSRRGKAPKALYEEPDLTIRVIRDVFSPVEFKEVVTDSKRIYEHITEYLQDVGPDVLDRVHLHEGKLPVMEAFHVHEQIHKALDRKVWLPSGGYVIIDRTEAMTVVDVNTGKAVGKRNLEETVVQTNIEAAREIARQLRLRDIGGIIVIDFIDMLLQANRSQVIRTLKEEMAQDKTRSQVFDITPLGLLEVTRKRVSAGLVEAFSETCPTCEGRGILVSLEA